MIINFDNAATTFPKPRSVKNAVYSALEKYGSAGRGGHAIASATSMAVYSARETAADFFGAEPENVIFTLNCTHALNTAIKGIMKNGGHMIISGMEHNSTARPSALLASEKKISLSVAQVYPEDEKTIESFRRLIKSDTKAVVCTIASNVTGQILPYQEIAEICQKNNICFIADGSQACGIIDIKLNQGINILCTAGHKGLYGITGTGLLISDGKYKIPSFMQGGTGNSSQSLIQPELMPESLESGTVNVPGIISMQAGIEFVKSIGINRIFSHEDRICRRFISELRKIKNITVYREASAEYVPIVSFNINDMKSEAAAEKLAEKGYCLRAGYHCSALAHSQLGTDSGTIRFSPSVFSKESDSVKLAGEIYRLSKK